MARMLYQVLQGLRFGNFLWDGRTSILRCGHATCSVGELMKSWIQQYLKEQARLAMALPADEIAAWIDLLRQARASGGQVFVCGNGGSAGNASHFAVDLGKGASGLGAGTSSGKADAHAPRFRVLSLNDNVPWLTALGNDIGYDHIFVEQLKNYGRKGDLLIGVSVSGNSPNVVKAVEWANGAGLMTLGLVGNRAGNRLASLARRAITVDGGHYGQVEDAQMHVLHLLCYAFIEGKAEGGKAEG